MLAHLETYRKCEAGTKIVSMASNVYYYHVPFKKKSNVLSLRTKIKGRIKQ